MKIEFEISDDTIKKSISKQLETWFSVDLWGRAGGEMAVAVHSAIKTHVTDAIAAIDVSKLVAERIREKMMPTIQQMIDMELKAAAKKAVKAAMQELAE
jgi:hypothetical protein